MCLHRALARAGTGFWGVHGVVQARDGRHGLLNYPSLILAFHHNFFDHCHSRMEGIFVYSMQTMPKTREHPWIMDQGEPWAAGRNGAVGMEEQFSMFSPFLAKFAKFKGSEVPVELGVQQGGRQECY